MNRDIKRKIGAWALFVSFFLFLQLGATSYWKIADQAYMFVGLAAMAVISVLVVRHRWRSLVNAPDRYTQSPSETRQGVLRSLRRRRGGDKNPPIGTGNRARYSHLFNSPTFPEGTRHSRTGRQIGWPTSSSIFRADTQATAHRNRQCPCGNLHLAARVPTRHKFCLRFHPCASSRF